MFENLSNRLQAVFSSLKKTGSIDETALETAMRDIRRALLEADVSLDIAKKFISEVKQKAIRRKSTNKSSAQSTSYKNSQR